MLEPNLFKNKNFIITGGLGYIGKKLINRLLDYNAKILCITRSEYPNIISNKNLQIKVLDYAETYLYQESINKCDFFIHLAFENSVSLAKNNPILHKQNNVFKLKKFLSNLDVEKKLNFIFPSTATIFGLTNTLPLTEKSKDNPLTFYDLNKLRCERIINLNRNNINPCIIRLPNIYGGGDSNNSDRNILFKIIINALKNKKIHCYNSGDYHREFIYIDDFINALLLSCVNLDGFLDTNFVNIGSDNKIKLIEILSKIQNILNNDFGYNISFEHYYVNALKDVNVRNYKCDDRLFRKLTNWSPNVDIDSGLRLLIKECINISNI